MSAETHYYCCQIKKRTDRIAELEQAIDDCINGVVPEPPADSGTADSTLITADSTVITSDTI